MPIPLIAPALLCLMLWLGGCAAPEPMMVPVIMKPELPAHLTDPLGRPERPVAQNRDLLQLLADYEELRRRANADRSAVVEIIDTNEGSEL
ncbi:hypothetical protein SAMN05216571_101399 [Onishia taeanensis]|uniref:Uncharacterized protein n=1 Tax=Onishia taeanensis TaxID=284577 RepID=A0A1G7NGY3_9GAMM|nr:hypothetical protein [Halomonas taeanensis]SDF72510.1 hypothetical protein SAMN05216571_101399 [Halomonas taeanensis]